MANGGMTAVNDVEKLRQRLARTKTTKIKMTTTVMRIRITIATYALSMMWTSVADDNEVVDCSDER